MRPFLVDQQPTAGRKVLTLCMAFLLVGLIAVCDWRITAAIPLGFLYLVPMFLFGSRLGPVLIVLLASLCTALAEAFDDLAFTQNEGIPRLLLYFSAFATAGFFVYEMNRSRSRTLMHVKEIEEQRDKIQETECQLESLIESSPASIVTTDTAGRILVANEAAHRLFEVALNSLKGSLIQTFIPALANVSEGGSSHPRFRAVMQARGIRADGDVFLADICFSTYPTASGSRLTAMIIDISEDLRQHEEASLKQLMLGSRVSAGAMSHEIRNVGAAIALAHHNLQRSGLIKGNDDFEALGSLVHTLQGLASAELSYTAPQHSEVDLFSLLNDFRVVISPAFADLGVNPLWDFTEDLPKVWADRSQVMQILLNLGNNSARAIESISDRQFAVSARFNQQRVNIEVWDNGGGVNDPSTLFQPFQPGAVASGLGLYISRSFARSMGGDLRYVTARDRACFLLELISLQRQA